LRRHLRLGRWPSSGRPNALGQQLGLDGQGVHLVEGRRRRPEGDGHPRDCAARARFDQKPAILELANGHVDAFVGAIIRATVRG